MCERKYTTAPIKAYTATFQNAELHRELFSNLCLFKRRNIQLPSTARNALYQE